MADTGAKTPGTIAEGTGGVYAWTNEAYVSADDTSFATTTAPTADMPYVFSGTGSVRLLSGGSLIGTGKSTGSLTTSEATHTFGGASDTWGASLTEAICNSSTFGVAVNTNLCNPINCTNYSCDVPSGATINGVAVGVRGYYVSGRINTIVYLDVITLTVFYTAAGGGTVIPVLMQQYRRRTL